jgi:magnesium-dependent phosphatase 1
MEGGGGGAAAAAGGAGAGQLPKVVVFDLDGCVWWPEMYMLWGGGSPFSQQPNGDLKDSAGKKTYLMGAVREIMHELKTSPRWAASKVAVASSCDEPAWARECIKKFCVGDGVPLSDIIAPNLIEIYKARSKQVHLTAISKASGVAFEEMMFLDNESGNCRAVAQLGVTVVYTPNGVTAEEWAHALQVFPQPGQIISI